MACGSTFKFSHPREYRIVGVAGRGAYAAVCKAAVLDEAVAEALGLLPEQSLSRQATTLSGQYSSDIVHDAPATTGTSSSDNALSAAGPAAVSMGSAHVSPLQQLQRQASAALADVAAGAMVDGSLGPADGSDPSLCTNSVVGSGDALAAQRRNTPPPQQQQPQDEDDAAVVSTEQQQQQQPRRGSSAQPKSYGDVAIKQLIDVASAQRAVSDSWREHYLRKVCREVEIIRHFNSVPQVINLGDVYMSSDECDLYIVMPYVAHNLRQIVEVYPLEEDLIRWIMCQLLLGLNALHNSGVVHRDLTLANVLVDGETWDVHIADFGLSRARESADKDISLDVVTLPYRAPEVLLEYTLYGNSIDIWAFGCIMAEAFLRAPFLYVDASKNPDSFKQLKQVIKFTGFPDVEHVAGMASITNANFLRNWSKQLGDNAPRGSDIGDLIRERRPDAPLSEEALDVLRGALQFEPARRLSAAQLLEKPWFRNNADCAGLIDMCTGPAVAQPGPCPTQVERMNFNELKAFLVAQSNGRRANVDSYVSELPRE
mmetsp:Transcript_31392/g.96975  ORF Transcript_31392/g.96975 Transcript_31392/m.96975 type:complete len:542 (-) Transcript_31392:226-1851(-)